MSAISTIPAISTIFAISKIWTIFTISSTVLVAHSSFNDKFHLNHHIYRTINYGHGTYMDRIFKTEII